MKKIILAVVIVAAVWFFGIWQAGRTAMGVLEEQTALVSEATSGLYGAEIEWIHKGWNSAQGVIIFNIPDEAIHISQPFTMEHGFFHSTYRGVLDVQTEDYNLADFYGEDGIVTTGSFSLGGFALSVDVAELNFTENDVTIAHAPFSINVFGEESIQHVDSDIEGLSITSSSMGEVMFFDGMEMLVAMDYDRNNRITHQDASFTLARAGLNFGGQSASIEGVEIRSDFKQQGSGFTAGLTQSIASLNFQGYDVTALIEAEYEGGDFEAYWESYERFKEKMNTADFQQMEKDKNMDAMMDEMMSIYMDVASSMMTPEAKLNVSVEVSDNPWIGMVDVALNYTGPNRSIASMELEELLKWAFDGNLEGSISGLPHQAQRMMNQQFGLRADAYPWSVLYTRIDGLKIDNQLIVPPEAIPTPQ
ncbi:MULTISPECIES: DUF945 family protein [Gammaproteobacteria]|uniref:DUF945 family protein n=1 Tax=Gammaproteobacteria TaxID=1236 RepID=UPI000DCF80FB|nr:MULTISPECIES: DUF945 family protein [Gammaproteobacteria]RTE86660.1 DUF945 family protein [Aliidiomarina sp. B3213]TCZ90787.1 DUF945 family protein [Lysobacter sp. N42]